MIKSIIFPHRYVQGSGAIKELPNLLSRIGENVFIILDPGVKSFLNDEIAEILSSFNIYIYDFNGESTEAEMRKCAEIIDQHSAQIVIGLGGGKALDTAKGAVTFLKRKVYTVIIPTIVSSDAPCSKNAVVYSDDHRVLGDIHGLFNPDIVLVDSQIIANAPTRFLSAGIGDGLATWLEAESVKKTMLKNFTGYSGTVTAFAIAELCHETLMKYGALAVQHVDQNLATPQLDDVIEAATLMSTIGFESGGLAAAHGYHQGLAELEETHDSLHGEKVSLGICASLFLTHKDVNFIREIYEFLYSVRLPICLEDLGITDTSDENLMIAVNRMMKEGEITHNEPINYSKEDYLTALKAADLYGKNFKNN